MKKIVYVYILDGMADWELGYIMSAINMKSMPTNEDTKYCIKTVGSSREVIQTLGGLTILPDISIDEIKKSDMAAILLPGSDRWGGSKQKMILKNIQMYMDEGIDTGQIIHQSRAIILPFDNPHQIGNRLIKIMTIVNSIFNIITLSRSKNC